MTARRFTRLALAALSLLAACERDAVTHVRVPKGAEAAPAAPPMMRSPMGQGTNARPDGERVGGTPAPAPLGPRDPAPTAAAVEPPPPPDEASALHWALPKGWSEKRESGMRYATLKPPGADKVEVSVVTLPGPAGGELANVNRWRGQLGLEPVDETRLASLRKAMPSKAGPLELFDLVSEGKERSRMLVALLSSEGGSTWFVKMTGSAEAVGARQAEFIAMLGSLQFGAAGGP